MSTYWYFECLDHTPALQSADEFTQHTDDDWYRLGVELAANRPQAADDGAYWTTAHQSDRERSQAYFRMNALKFLHEHPTCRLGAISEYGVRRPLPAAEPPRIEDLTPGTTFTGKHVEPEECGGIEHRWFITGNSERTLAVSDEGQRWAVDCIDPSTIRDVTPPAVTT